MNANANTLIAFDGLDGSGKETQTKMMFSYFKAKGIPYRYVSFPTYHKDWSCLVERYLKGALGSDPQSVNAYAASSFFAADRYCSFITDWKADYDNGSVILCNRYTTANAVHQLSKLPEEAWDAFLDWLYDYEFNRLGLPCPALSFYLCVTPEVAEKHIRMRAESDNRSMDIHETNAEHLRKSYKAALFSAKRLGWKTVDCIDHLTGDMRSPVSIHEEIKERLEEYFSESNHTASGRI